MRGSRPDSWATRDPFASASTTKGTRANSPSASSRPNVIVNTSARDASPSTITSDGSKIQPVPSGASLCVPPPDSDTCVASSSATTTARSRSDAAL